MSKKTTSQTGSRRRAARSKRQPPAKREVPPASPAPAPAPDPRSHRELAKAIFAGCNAVEVGRELLQSGSERGATVRARMFETLANWQFGKPAAPAGGTTGAVRVIWDLPAPPHEHRDDD
jgi:hypothetical protein